MSVFLKGKKTLILVIFQRYKRRIWKVTISTSILAIVARHLLFQKTTGAMLNKTELLFFGFFWVHVLQLFNSLP